MSEAPANANGPNALNARGNACVAVADYAGAYDAYSAALGVLPGHPVLLLNRAGAALQLGELDSAERDARDAMNASPDYEEAYFLLGLILGAQHRHAEAAQVYAQGETLAPQDARFPYQLGLALDERHDIAGAADAWQRALQRDPNMHAALSHLVYAKRRLYDWDDLDAFTADLRRRVEERASGITPFSFLAEDVDPSEQLQCAATMAMRIETKAKPLRERLALAYPLPADDAPLRVGMLSAGFGSHPTALLLVAALEALRDQAVVLHAFATTSDDGSPWRARIAAATTLHDVSMLNDADAARAVHAAQCDVLLDIDGWCDGSRPGVLALRPAPLQVSWLAYPGSTGAAWIDYAIADRFVLPNSLLPSFSERVAYLPRCYQPSDPTRVILDAPPRAAFGLPDDAVVFASFNNSWKLNASSFARMCAVLREVPGSVLWLLDAGREPDARLRAAAQADGVDPHRLIFSPKLPHPQHLARYRLADLFLDTHPYNAHTTASDALWAGCPVLTRPGEALASRVAGSLNHHLHLPECNARDDNDFVATAIRLGLDRPVLVAVRDRLKQRRADSGLFDMQGYARDFAALLREMVERRRHNVAPVDFVLAQPGPMDGSP
ncbi:MAG: UDP-N-acetylglucosamine-peptide N-acetylglucosaminyltransferase [Rhodanobacteraceae bacterium]